MSKRNGPSAREHALAEDKRNGDGHPGHASRSVRYSRTEYQKVLAVQDEVSRADGDYQRLRNAYVEMTRSEPTHEVGLAMIGADMDRAHARLQSLLGNGRLPVTHEPSSVLRREALRRPEDEG